MPLLRLLEHRLTRGLSLDDPATTELRKAIIQSKPFLRRIYLEWYRLLADSLPPGPGAVVELGSGAGFFREVVPEAVTSEVFFSPGVQVVLDGQELPFASGSLRAIAMVDVLHHLPRCRRFFASAARCVRPGGAIVAIEPWVTAWSRFVYGRMHHEPFSPEGPAWDFPSSGPLSGANLALPWIALERDRPTFEHRFPQWRVARARPFMPFRYLASGGVGMRSLAPGWAFRVCTVLEDLLSPAARHLGMFAHLVVERTPVPSRDDGDSA